ncbi:hypothetical protein GCM10008941_38520 [Rhizomicrobium palustre]
MRKAHRPFHHLVGIAGLITLGIDRLVARETYRRAKAFHLRFADAARIGKEAAIMLATRWTVCGMFDQGLGKPAVQRVLLKRHKPGAARTWRTLE